MRSSNMYMTAYNAIPAFFNKTPYTGIDSIIKSTQTKIQSLKTHKEMVVPAPLFTTNFVDPPRNQFVVPQPFLGTHFRFKHLGEI